MDFVKILKHTPSSLKKQPGPDLQHSPFHHFSLSSVTAPFFLKA
jgi:hypothetical protein